MLMDKNKKRNMGIFSFVPLALLLITLVYEDSLLNGLFSTFYHHDANSVIAAHYNTLVWLYSFTAIATIAMMLYFIVQIASIKNMNSAAKIAWIAILALLIPVSFPLFWYLQIRKETLHLETKADIA